MKPSSVSKPSLLRELGSGRKQDVLTSGPLQLLAFCLEYSAQSNLSCFSYTVQVILICLVSLVTTAVAYNSSSTHAHASMHVHKHTQTRGEERREGEGERDRSLLPSSCLKLPFLALSIELLYILHIYCVGVSLLQLQQLLSKSMHLYLPNLLLYPLGPEEWLGPTKNTVCSGKEDRSVNLNRFFGSQYCGLWCPGS